MARLQVQSSEWQHWRVVQNNSRSKTRMSSVTHPFNIFLERIRSDVLEEHDGKVNIGGINTCITNLWFAEDIDALAEEEQELEALAESLYKPCTR